jgi:hypothetical protein
MGMSGNFFNRDNVDRDAEDIAGFFGTRVGKIVALVLVGLFVVGMIGSALTGLM